MVVTCGDVGGPATRGQGLDRNQAVAGAPVAELTIVIPAPAPHPAVGDGAAMTAAGRDGRRPALQRGDEYGRDLLIRIQGQLAGGGQTGASTVSTPAAEVIARCRRRHQGEGGAQWIAPALSPGDGAANGRIDGQGTVGIVEDHLIQPAGVLARLAGFVLLVGPGQGVGPGGDVNGELCPVGLTGDGAFFDSIQVEGQIIPTLLTGDLPPEGQVGRTGEGGLQFAGLAVADGARLGGVDAIVGHPILGEPGGAAGRAMVNSGV